MIGGCKTKELIQRKGLPSGQYYVSCQPHILYCYKKSDMICHKGYRILVLDSWNENPQMTIECE